MAILEGKKKAPRVVIAKPGLDGHTRGAKMVAWALRDAGMEVIYTGTRLTPEEIVNVVVQEDADILGVSLLSGAHMEIFGDIMERLRQQGLTNVLFVGGGIIPPEDAEQLKKMGVAEIFPPGTRLDAISSKVWELWRNPVRRMMTKPVDHEAAPVEEPTASRDMKTCAYQTIKYEIDGAAAIVTFNRPERRNAINEKMVEEVNRALDEAEGNNDVRVIIFTGSEQTFCSGADLKGTWTLETSLKLNQLFVRIENMAKPSIAAINGYALGGGCEWALACDFRIAADTASLGLTEVLVGVMPTGGATFRLPRLVGEAKAKELMLIGNTVSGTEAGRIGLVNKTVPENDVLKEARGLAALLADRPPLSLKAVKECIRATTRVDTENAIRFMLERAETLRSTEDYREGRQAFREKRKPVWKGK